ncbi:putative glycosyltransferase EpsJ [Ureibacillus acetophenoni]
MKVSIIVPIYNTELYLTDCVRSIINQTYQNLEVILVNDGSKDNSGIICDEFSKFDNRIKVIHKENGGVSSARNMGLDISTGDYIMFVDSDDWIENNAVDKLINIQNQGNFDVVMFGAYFEYTKQNKIVNFILRDEKYYELSKIKSILPSLIKEEKINTLWNKLYKSSLIKNNKIRFNESLSIAEMHFLIMKYLCM